VRLNGPPARAAFRFQRLIGRGIEAATQGQIGEPLLRNIRVLMALVRTQRIKGADAENTDNATEDVRPFKVQIEQFLRSFLNKVDSVFQVS